MLPCLCCCHSSGTGAGAGTAGVTPIGGSATGSATDAATACNVHLTTHTRPKNTRWQKKTNKTKLMNCYERLEG